jgi:hypothetical protein
VPAPSGYTIKNAKAEPLLPSKTQPADNPEQTMSIARHSRELMPDRSTFDGSKTAPDLALRTHAPVRGYESGEDRSAIPMPLIGYIRTPIPALIDKTPATPEIGGPW